MKPRQLILFIIITGSLIFNGVGSFAQSEARAKADSLIKVLSSYNKNDSNKVNLLIGIAHFYQLINYDTSLKYGKEGLDLARTLNWNHGMADCLHNMSAAYRHKSLFPEALDAAFAAMKIYGDANDKPKLAMINGNIGLIFVYQHKYSEAMKYETVALNLYTELGNKDAIAGELGDIATLYWMNKKYDSALLISFRSLDMYESLKNEKEMLRTYGNLGMIYGDAGNYSQSLAYNFKALNGFKKRGDSRRSVSIRYANIGQAYLDAAEHIDLVKPDSLIPIGKMSVLGMATAYLDTGIAMFKELGDLYGLQEASKSRAKAAELLDDYKAAFENYELYISTRDSIFSTENKVKIAKAEAKHELEIAQLSLAKKENEKWFFISVIFLLSVIGLLYINRQRIKQKKLESDKKYAENELDGFKKSIYEKNLIIERVTMEMERLKKEGEQEADNELINQLERSLILTDEQWDNFRVLFEKVHKGFFVNLKRKMPDLTQAEIRLLALTKLKLTAKEMASMMGISPATIRIYRHRLRRKLELDKEEMIEELVENI